MTGAAFFLWRRCNLGACCLHHQTWGRGRRADRPSDVGELGGKRSSQRHPLGTDVDGSICDGTFIHVEGNLTSATPFALFINSSVADPKDPPFRLPGDVANASITVIAGLGGPSAATYSSAGRDCGVVTFCLREPVPSSVVCSGSKNCAPGCDLEGPVSDLTCTPVAPEVCCIAQAAPDCVSDSSFKPVIGDWTLEIASVAFLDGGGCQLGGRGTRRTARSSPRWSRTARTPRQPPSLYVQAHSSRRSPSLRRRGGGSRCRHRHGFEISKDRRRESGETAEDLTRAPFRGYRSLRGAQRRSGAARRTRLVAEGPR